jgi:hypothetical protein
MWDVDEENGGDNLRICGMQLKLLWERSEENGGEQ